MKIRIISGGQTGVDQMALLVAERLGIPTGGWCPHGCRTDAGPYFDLVTRFGLRELISPNYPARTIANVRDSDATIWFGRVSPGYECTKTAAGKHHKPFWVNKDADELYGLVLTLGTITRPLFHDGWTVLNVAGNRLATNPKAAERCAVVMNELLSALKRGVIM